MGFEQLVKEWEMEMDKKQSHISFRVNEEEYMMFQRVCREYHGETVSGYIRKVIRNEYKKLIKKGELKDE